ncbi:MAG: hypothetical protein FWF25_05015 [Propionibacteriaceae bacterium]|nr:hypothetical protein [Propionibacteriaceae bacterium]
MSTGSQHTPHDDNSDVLSDIERGETSAIPRPSQPVSRQFDPSQIHPVTSVYTTTDVLDDLRGER